MGVLLASVNDLTNCSISNAAFFRLSYDRSPNDRWMSGGKGDSTETNTCPPPLIAVVLCCVAVTVTVDEDDPDDDDDDGFDCCFVVMLL